MRARRAYALSYLSYLPTEGVACVGLLNGYKLPPVDDMGYVSICGVGWIRTNTGEHGPAGMFSPGLKPLLCYLSYYPFVPNVER
jgi:hypothetical protein